VDVSHAHTMLSELQEAVDSRVNAKAGSDAPLTQTIADAILNQFAALEAFLVAEQIAQQLVATNSNDKIKSCNSQVGNNMIAVDELDADVVTKRGEHKSCRVTEDVNMDTAGTDCQTYYDAGTSFVSKAPDCACLYSSTSTVVDMTNAVALKQCYDDHHKWIEDHALFLSKKATCESSSTTFDQKNVACNNAQGDFERDFCAYAVKLTDTCKTYTTCMAPVGFPTLNFEHANAKQNIKTLVSAHKAAFVSVKTATCFVNLLTKSVISQAEVTACSAETHDTAHLDVVYPDKVEGDDCDDSGASPTPGSVQWHNAEYVQGDTCTGSAVLDDAGCNAEWEALVLGNGINVNCTV